MRRAATMLLNLLAQVALLSLPVSLAMPQDNPQDNQPPQGTSSLSSPTAMPSPSDNASQNQSSTNTGDLVNYYFVFLALIIVIAGVAAYLMWRRRRKYGAIIRASRENALERDLNGWDPVRARRRYWQGRWRSVDASREEGLNEHGEAPPPYMTKTEGEEEGHRTRENEPEVPLQTLSREQVGLKPPDYAEVNVSEAGRTSTASNMGDTLQPPPHTHREV